DVDSRDVCLDELLDRLGVEELLRRQDLLALRAKRGAAQGATVQLRSGVVVDGHAVVDASERRLHEAELIDLGVRRQVADQSDVRAFGGLDRTDAAVVAVVDVTDVEAGALAGQAAWPEGRQPALVRELGGRVVLVHELRQLAGAEELLDRSHHRSGVDERCRGDRVRVTDRHPLLDDALHADQSHTELVLQQLADRADTAVAEVVDVIRDLLLARRVVELDQLAQEGDEVTLLENPELTLADAREDVRLVAAQTLVHLVPADSTEVEAARVEEQALQQVAGVVDRRRIARTDAPVELEERVLGLHRRVLVE